MLPYIALFSNLRFKFLIKSQLYVNYMHFINDPFESSVLETCRREVIVRFCVRKFKHAVIDVQNFIFRKMSGEDLL